MRKRGYVLPIVLVIVAALFVISVGALSLSRLQRKSARDYVDSRQAELAIDAGLKKAIELILEESRDDNYLIVQSDHDAEAAGQRMAPCLYSTRWVDGNFHYQPLFSAEGAASTAEILEAPELAITDHGVRRLDWLLMDDESGQLVARYMFWMEDLQRKVDPMVMGNLTGGEAGHQRASYRDMDVASGDAIPANQVALYSLDPEATNRDQGELARRLIMKREMLVSPLSHYAVMGSMDEALLKVLDESVVCGNRPYHELALVPPVKGVSADVVGKQKMNLNKMLEIGGGDAVGQMSDWIRMGLPEFEQRKGGFPDDYLKSLAANGIDYADRNSQSTRSAGEYAGVDSYPLLSEIVLHLHFQKLQQRDGRWVMVWTVRVFAELWNMTNQLIEGGVARASYEVDLRPTPIGAGTGAVPFDDPIILRDPLQSKHKLERMGDRFYGPEIEVSLLPDQYRFYEVAKVDYSIDVSPMMDANGEVIVESFDLAEPEDKMRGMTLMWNGQPVHRVPKILRDPHGLSNFVTDETRKTAKACIPGHSYGGYGGAVNNMGDPRIAPHLRAIPLGENAYPDNLSPHRRNIRRRNIYDRDQTPEKARHYGRVLPSQWPDGGHDSAVGNFRMTTSHSALPTDQSKWPIHEVPPPEVCNAPQRISNAGRFFSPTELGHIFDPVMWLPVYSDLEGVPGSGEEDTEVLLRLNSSFYRPAMPTRRQHWPDVTRWSQASAHYGGGNTLRIGRPEHERFDKPGWRASRLLDLFHVGQPFSDGETERSGNLVKIHGHVNLNTASEDVLRCMAAGGLSRDPRLCRVMDAAHDTAHSLAAQTEPLEIGAPMEESLADVVARAIVRNRPYASPSELAEIKDEEGRPIFGNKQLHDDGESLQWSDAAAEELFARVHDASTVRSRNFRVWVIGQALDGSVENPEVVAESRRVFTVFSDPGERGENGEIQNQKVRVRYAMDF